jgi:hypothetical protein
LTISGSAAMSAAVVLKFTTQARSRYAPSTTAFETYV